MPTGLQIASLVEREDGPPVGQQVALIVMQDALELDLQSAELVMGPAKPANGVDSAKHPARAVEIVRPAVMEPLVRPDNNALEPAIQDTGVLAGALIDYAKEDVLPEGMAPEVARQPNAREPARQELTLRRQPSPLPIHAHRARLEGGDRLGLLMRTAAANARLDVTDTPHRRALPAPVPAKKAATVARV